MKKIYFAIIISLFVKISVGQIDSSLNKIISKNVQYYSVIDTNIIEQYYYQSRKKNKKLDGGNKFLFINDFPIDSSGLRMRNYPLLLNDIIYFISEENSNLYSINQLCELTKMSSQINSLDVLNNNLITKIDNLIYRVIYEHDSLAPVVDLSRFLDTEITIGGDFDSFENYYGFANKLLLIKARCNIGCWNYRVYLYHTVKDTLSEISWLSKDESKQGIKCDLFISSDSNLIINITGSIDTLKNGEWLLNGDLNPVNRTLSKHQIDWDAYNSDQNRFYNFPHIAGLNYQNGERENYFLQVTLDNKQQVIVPYKFIPQLEITMYKAYNDTLLTEEELKGLGSYELGILRNLIFAKHNYDFSSEFYQAYFNLFAFYNHPDMRNSRTKNVNHLLTEQDKENLNLIKELEGKL